LFCLFIVDICFQ
jgi:hypothetical protein